MRKQLIKTLIILLTGLICLYALSFSASAEGTAGLMETDSGSCGENLTWTLDTDTGLLTISGTGNMYNYGSGSAPWFLYFNLITNASISNGVTSIGDYAFYSCGSLTNVSIPDSITSIGSYAFAHAECLANVTIPSNVTSIGQEAFWNCKSLTEITIPAATSRIGDGVFDGCDSLQTITVESGNTSYCSESGVFFNADKTKLLKYPAKKTASEYHVPDSVTSIAEYAFSFSEYLTKLVIPSTATNIGMAAFSYCTNLTSAGPIGSGCHIEFGWTTEIPRNAFHYCNNLTSVSFPDSVTTIESFAFADCSSLPSITLPNGVTSIGFRAFEFCSNLTEITMPNSLTEVSDCAFWGCSALTSVMFPEGVTSIGGSAFSNCSGLTSVAIPQTVIYIGYGAFESCTSLKAITVEPANTSYCSEDGILFNSEKTKLIQYPSGRTETSYAIPNTVTSMERYAFSGCSNLLNITIPENLKNFSYGTFSGCTNLTSAGPIGSGCSIEYEWFYLIPSEAFSSSNLTSIILSSDIHRIGTNAFENCDSLTTVYYRGNAVNPWDDIYVEDGNEALLQADYYYFGVCGNNLIWTIDPKSGEMVISGTGEMTNWPIPMSGKSWGYIYAPWYKEHNDQITSVTINDGVTSIGNLAFYECSNLKIITIPESVTIIGNSAFYGCSSLIGITLPNSITAIAESAFRNCSSLTDFTIPDSVTSIGTSAFYGCSKLTGVSIPLSVTSIGNGAFYGCSSLNSISIPISVSSISENTFSGCSSLTGITIPDSVTSIGSSAFAYCSSLTGITIPNSVTSIGNSTFSGCSSMTEITIPSSVTSIGTGVFGYCTSLSAITVESGNPAYCSENGVLFNMEKTELIQYPAKKADSSYVVPNTVTSLPDYAFYGSRLRDITLSSGLTKIGVSAFQDCVGLTSITIPDQVTSIGSWAFYGCTNLTTIIIPESAVDISWLGVFSNSSLKSAGPIGSGCNIEFGWKTAIPSNAFMGCSGLTSITIPDTVTNIGAYAFTGCNNLTAMTLPVGLASIDQRGYRSEYESAERHYIRVADRDGVV